MKLLEGWGCDSGQTGGEVGSQNPHDPEWQRAALARKGSGTCCEAFDSSESFGVVGADRSGAAGA